MNKYDIPLGTANWLTFPDDHQPVFNPLAGDIFLSLTMDGQPVGLRDDRHIAVCAGSRSGKGVSIIIPNLITYLGSVVVVDPKGENALITARRRGHGSMTVKAIRQRVYILDPLNEVKTDADDFSDLKACFNPLDLLSVDKPESIDNAARIADSLIDSEASTSDPFWNDAARALIKAVILHVISDSEYASKDRNLITVRRLIMEGYAKLRALIAANNAKGKAPSAYKLMFEAMADNKAFGGEVALAGNRFMSMEDGSPRLFESITQVAATNLDFLASSEMKACVSRSSFRIEELKTDPKGISLYLCLPQRFMGTHFRFLRMMTTLIITEMERVRHQPKCGYPILMVLDEFAALKKMAIIENASAQIAGYGVRMMMVVQTLGQLKSIYKDNWETLLANCGVKLFLGNDDHFTRDYASKLIGECEVVRRTASVSKTEGKSSSQMSGQSLGHSNSAAQGSTRSMSTGGGNQGSMQFSVSNSATNTSGLTLTFNQSETSGTTQSATQGTTESVHKRMLVTPDEVGRLFGNRNDMNVLAILSGLQPLRLRRLRYFKQIDFVGAFDPHPDHPLPPTREELEAEIAQEQARDCAERERLAQQQRAADEAKNEAIRLKNERYFEQRRQERYWSEQVHLRAYEEKQAERRKELIKSFSVLGAFIVLLIFINAW